MCIRTSVSHNDAEEHHLIRAIALLGSLNRAHDGREDDVDHQDGETDGANHVFPPRTVER